MDRGIISERDKIREYFYHAQNIFERFKPPKDSLLSSCREGSFRILAELSVQRPTAAIEARSVPASSREISMHATWYSRGMCLIINVHHYAH
jgi:hypothetical protein